MDPILINLPMPILTPRLLLRPPQPGDGPELNRSIVESLESLKPWMIWAQTAPSVEESEANVRHAHVKFLQRSDLRVVIYDRETGLMAGSTGLHRINWDLPSFEIGWWVRTRFAGRGYVTEAANALTRYAFGQLNARRVEVRCDAENERSVAVIKRLGFEHEGTLRNESTNSAPAPELRQFRDTVIYARLTSAGLPDLEVSW